MHGYVPPYRGLPHYGPAYGLETSPRLPGYFATDFGAVPLKDTLSELPSPICVMGDLLQYHGVKTQLGPLASVDVHALLRHVYGEIRAPLRNWPLSFQVIHEALCGRFGTPFRTGTRRVDRETGEIEVAEDEHGIDLSRLTLLSVANTRWTLQSAIAQGYPVAAGLAIAERWDDAATGATGEVRMPLAGEALVDGASVVLVGWDDRNEHFIFRNVEGRQWGHDGYGTLPYSYVCSSNLCHELVIVYSV